MLCDLLRFSLSLSDVFVLLLIGMENLVVCGLESPCVPLSKSAARTYVRTHASHNGLTVSHSLSESSYVPRVHVFHIYVLGVHVPCVDPPYVRTMHGRTTYARTAARIENGQVVTHRCLYSPLNGIVIKITCAVGAMDITRIAYSNVHAFET